MIPPLLQWFLWFFVTTLIACVGGVLLWRYKMIVVLAFTVAALVVAYLCTLDWGGI